MATGAEMEFSAVLLRFARIGKMTRGGGNRWVFASCDMINAWVEDAGTPSVLVDQNCRTIGLLSYDLPPGAWLPRKQS